jgi:hypothetical protein
MPPCDISSRRGFLRQRTRKAKTPAGDG